MKPILELAGLRVERSRTTILRGVDQLARRKDSPALVLVTHHVEEITPAFTHALRLRAGAVVAAGRRRPVLTSANLSATFAARLRLNRTGPRHRLEFPRP